MIAALSRALARPAVQRSLEVAVWVGAVVVMVTLAPLGSFIDEYDVLLGAQQLAEGEGIPFRDYFSHHMPLAYLAVAPLMLVTASNLIAVRILFVVLLAAWLFAMWRPLRAGFGRLPAAAFVATVAACFSLGQYNFVLAETFIAFATAHAVILFLTRNVPGTRVLQRVVGIILLASVPVLAALAYAPVSIVLYLLALVTAIQRRAELRRTGWGIAIAAVLLPYVLLLGWLAAFGALGDFVFQAFTFNTLYYAQVNPGAPQSFVQAILLVPSLFLAGLVGSFVDPVLTSQPIVALATVGTVLALVALVAQRRWRTAAWMAVLLAAAGSRGLGGGPAGLAAVVGSNQWARHGETVFLVELLVMLVATVVSVQTLRARFGPAAGRAGTRRAVRPVVAVAAAVALLGVAAFEAGVLLRTIPGTIEGAKHVVRGDYLVTVPAGEAAASTVVNIVNADGGTYWLAPAEFGQQLLIDSRRVNRYPFYMDQVGICVECHAEVLASIRDERPNVVYFAPGSIYGRGVVPELRSEIEDLYFTVDDPRLDGFLFLAERRDAILDRLRDAGYEVD